LIPRNESLLAEYEAANKFVNHVDELNWQVGSILIGGSIAAVALSFNVANSQLRLAPAFVSLAGMISVACWFIYVRRGRGMTRIAIARMMMIEYSLGLEFHRYLYFADHNRPRQVTFAYPFARPETIEMPIPTGWGTVRLLTLGIILVFAAVVVYVLLVLV
jgi:uncharacterized membrane protein